MKIKLSDIRAIAKNTSYKTVPSKDNIHIQASMYPLLKDNAQYLEELDAYQTANIMDNVNSWKSLHKKKKLIELRQDQYQSYRYQARDIVMVRLGGTNVGYEASYNHPAIVIQQGYNWILIAPCSTGQFNKNYPSIVKAFQSSDGVNRNTAIQVDKIRVVDKWRVESKLGRLSAARFQELTNKFVEMYSPYHIRQLKYKEGKLQKLLKEKEVLIEGNSKLEVKVDELIRDNELLKKELEAMRDSSVKNEK